MADWHLKDLDDYLLTVGWQIVAQHPGNDRNISGSWEVQRSTRYPSIWIDFHGLDDMECLPLEKAYACQIRGKPSLSLYFGKKGPHWQETLREFVIALEYSDKDLLMRLMSEISEKCFAAEWMQYTEFALWKATQEGSAPWGQGEITAEDIATLKSLSESTAGWFRWSEEAGAVFVPLDTWLDLYWRQD